MNAIKELQETISCLSRAGKIDVCTKLDLQKILNYIENEYMELPKDRLGQTVRVGDVLNLENGVSYKVKSIINKYLVTEVHDAILFTNIYNLQSKDTWENIESDAEDYAWRYCQKHHYEYTDLDDAKDFQCRNLVQRCKELVGEKDD